jgi:hypothetical protein
MNRRILIGFGPALALLLSAGCASTAPKAQFAHEIVADARISSPDSVQVNVGAPESVPILPGEKDRLGQKIKARIDAQKISHPRDGEGRAYEVDLQLSRYDKGNSFARAMLAGLGQMHIDGRVSVYQSPEHALVGEFDLAKTFAWGGIYGASTSIEDIEVAFADGIADAVTGHSSTPSTGHSGMPSKH